MKNTNVMHILSEGNASVVEPVQQKESPKSTKDVAAKKEPSTEVDQPKNEHLSQPEHTNSGPSATDSLVLLCCKDALCLYPLKSVLIPFKICCKDYCVYKLL